MNIQNINFELFEDSFLKSFLIMCNYNGIIDEFEKWYNLEPNDKRINCPLTFNDSEDLIFVWGMLVLLFGDYGTSPRFGWITDVYYFRIFLKKCIQYEEG